MNTPSTSAIKTVAIIANGSAGAQRASHWVERARRELWGYKLEAHFPATSLELQELCGRLTRDRYLAVIVIGGDGTQNQALQGRWKALAGNALSGSAHSDNDSTLAPLYSFPGGTANDLSAELGIRADLNQMQRLLDQDKQTQIDVISVNGVPFSTVAGIGVGAALTQAINDTRRNSRVFCGLMRTLKSEVYAAMSAKTILASKAFLHDVRIESDSFSERLEVAAVFVCNQDHLAGNIRVSEKSSNQDGLFSVLVIPGKNTIALLKDLMTMKSGKIPQGAYRFSTRQLTLLSQQDREIPVFGDGEVLLQHKRLYFELHPKSLTVFTDPALGASRKQLLNPASRELS